MDEPRCLMELIERLAAPALMWRMFDDELKRLDAYAQAQAGVGKAPA